MSDSDTTGFGKFVPGFDFLQNLVKGSGPSAPSMPSFAGWVAPTLNPQELKKRIEELKHVQFWLEQNSRALAATIQALEVQKMTMATLQGMNFNLGDVANAFVPKAAAPATPAPKPAADKAPEKPVEKPAATAPRSRPEKAGVSAPAMVDPLQLWGALTQQFQQIAASAVQQAAAKPAVAKAAKATKAEKAPAKRAAPRKAPRKAAGR